MLQGDFNAPEILHLKNTITGFLTRLVVSSLKKPSSSTISISCKIAIRIDNDLYRILNHAEAASSIGGFSDNVFVGFTFMTASCELIRLPRALSIFVPRANLDKVSVFSALGTNRCC